MIGRTLRILLLTMLVFALFPTAAQAYIGPGLGLGAIGAAIGVFFSFFLAAFAVLWYPIKKLIRRLRKTEAEPSEAAETKDAADPP